MLGCCLWDVKTILNERLDLVLSLRVTLRTMVCLLVVLQFLPVYNPSQEEKNNPNLYADNVQKLMAK